jgi:glutamyl-tRNA synthetase
LSGSTPAFGHHNLLTNASGEGLSKRSGALSIASLRESGVEALAVAALAVQVGSAIAVHPVASLVDLASELDLGKLSQASARFDEAELRALSARTLHHLAFPAVASRLALLGVGGALAEAFWLAVRGNLPTLADAREWWEVVTGEIEPVVEDPGFLALAYRELPAEPWTAQTWPTWTARLKNQTGRKGRALFHPLRLALTGKDAGPDLGPLLPLIGREKASFRLHAPSV